MKSTTKKEPTLLEFVESLKQQWMQTIDALVDPLIIIAKDYRIIKANLALAKRADASITSIIGQKCHEVFARSPKPCEGCQLQRTFAQEKPSQFELQQDDEYFEVSSQLLRHSHGEIEGVVHTYRDRSEAIKLREQLLQSEKLSSIGLLAGGVAHEINNPLGGILVFSQMLLRELPETSAHRGDVEEILRAAERCKSIVDQLLDFARTRKRSDDQVADLRTSLETAERFALMGAPKSKINVRTDIEDIKLLADDNVLVQLFLNLLQNAVHAMPKGGTITIHGRKNADSYELTISDTGVGIKAKDLKKIFDPFFTTKDPGQGTGLGLSICFSIMKELGGRIGVRSKLKEGTSFTLSFMTDSSRARVS